MKPLSQFITAHGSTPYVGMIPKKKMAARFKVHKRHARNSCVRSANGLHEPYQVLSNASMGNMIGSFAGKHR